MSEHTGGTWRPSTKSGGAIVSDIVLDEPYLNTGHNETEYYGGHLIAESVRANNRPIIAAAPEMLATLDAVRDHLWARLCDMNITDRADHPVARLYLRVEAAVELARHGRPA
ncbi:MAG TPA: hypothetical protein VFH17_08335 [Coriobacteriia bacterium]|nr:hypothetical protein [Coriobacteriia bacterium]